MIEIKFNKTISPVVLILPKMSGYVKTSKVKEGDKDKNNKLMSFQIDNEKLLEKNKAIWARIEDFLKNELIALPVYDDRYTKIKMKTYSDNVYANFRGLNVLEDETEYESFTFISIDSLLVYKNKYYIQVYLDNWA